MEETLKIIKRNEEEITFSIHKIVEAITDAARQIINECFERIHEAFLAMLHSTWHWLMHWFHRKNHRKENLIGCPLHALFSTAILFSCVQPVTSVFFRFSQRIRNIYLLRTQDRSNDADNADNNFIHIATTTV